MADHKRPPASQIWHDFRSRTQLNTSPSKPDACRTAVKTSRAKNHSRPRTIATLSALFWNVAEVVLIGLFLVAVSKMSGSQSPDSLQDHLNQLRPQFALSCDTIGIIFSPYIQGKYSYTGKVAWWVKKLVWEFSSAILSSLSQGR